MVCTSPMDAYPAPPGAPNRKPVFAASASYEGARPFKLQCGRCMACRLSVARDWDTRIAHECQLHESNLFFTPTYADEHLPSDWSVSMRTHQLLVKRVRNRFGAGIRFFGCGEYGERHRRPHYHTIFFGLDLPDLKQWANSDSGQPMFRSAEVERLWPFGHCLVQRVSLGAGAYIARYTTKKVYGQRASDHYRRTSTDPVTGEFREWWVKPEFLVMSRRPGIGADWLLRFPGDVADGRVVINGERRSVPRFYVERLGDRERDRLLRERKAAALADVRKRPGEYVERRVYDRHQFGQLKADRVERDLGVSGE